MDKYQHYNYSYYCRMINRFEIQFQAKQVVGEYINRDESSLSTGNFVFFTDDEYGYCKDLKCKQIC